MALWQSEYLPLLLEILAVLFGIAYVILAARQHILCWSMGIIGSLISVYLFIKYAHLYTEAFLYVFYIAAGIYGWINWHKKELSKQAYVYPVRTHILYISVGLALSLLLYFCIKYTLPEAQKPLLDSFTTVFSIIATYMAARKWLENWIYWIIIDAATCWMYASRNMYVYAALMGAYTLLAIYAYIQWKKYTLIKVA